MKNCKECNKEFKPRFGTEKFCSRKCYGKSRRAISVKTKCGYCNEAMNVKIFKFRNHGRHFCSIDCYYKSMVKHHKEIRTCLVCGDEFETMSNKKNKHCSTDCSNITNAINRREKNFKMLLDELERDFILEEEYI